MERLRKAEDVVEAIRRSGLTIYDPLEGRPDLYLERAEIESLLNERLMGFDLNYPIRTRSKRIKSQICQVLGYPVPRSFRRSKPRFPGQNFDTYVQKADNLQVWNEEVEPTRRYVIIRVDDEGHVRKVKVISGAALSLLDTTGTLTQKYQASSIGPVTESALVSGSDTEPVARSICEGGNPYCLLPIQELYTRLTGILGQTFRDPGLSQERNRGAAIHEAVCRCFPGTDFHDSGQFPDVPRQLLELKLQTAPTIDLGLVSPDGVERLPDMPPFRHCDVRYGVFYGRTDGVNVTVDRLILTTGEDFFTFFRRFEGRVVNRKLQIPLPRNFFE